MPQGDVAEGTVDGAGCAPGPTALDDGPFGTDSASAGLGRITALPGVNGLVEVGIGGALQPQQPAMATTRSAGARIV